MVLLWKHDSAVSGFGPKRVERLINSSTTCLSPRTASQHKSPLRPPASTKTHPKSLPSTMRPPWRSADDEPIEASSVAAASAESSAMDIRRLPCLRDL